MSVAEKAGKNTHIHSHTHTLTHTYILTHTWHSHTHTLTHDTHSHTHIYSHTHDTHTHTHTHHTLFHSHTHSQLHKHFPLKAHICAIRYARNTLVNFDKTLQNFKSSVVLSWYRPNICKHLSTFIFQTHDVTLNVTIGFLTAIHG